VPSIFPPTLPPVGAMMAVLVPTSSPFEFTSAPAGVAGIDGGVGPSLTGKDVRLAETIAVGL
jgi:hypothetical protein